MSATPFIQTLPPEILGKIFVECLPPNPCARLDPTQAPISLSQVCSSWRTIAFAEQALCDTLIFTPDFNSTSAARRFISKGRVDRWFERTGPDRLLSLGQEGSQGKRGSAPSRGPVVMLFEDYTHLITKYARRLGHISIVLSRVPSRNYFVDQLPHDNIYPELKSLSIYSTNLLPHALEDHPTMPTPFKMAPKLREIALTLPWFDPLALELPWRQLTKLTLPRKQRMDVNSWLAVFDACPALREAVLPRPWSVTNSPPPPPPLPPTNLHLSGSYDPLRRLHTALKSLTLIAEGSARPPLGDWCVFEQFIDFPFLEHLELHSKEGGRLVASELVYKSARLKSFQNLISLVFENSSSRMFFDEVMHFVRSLKFKDDVLNSLAHLTIPWEDTGAYAFDSHVETVVALLESRSSMGTHPGLTIDVTGVNEEDERVNWEKSVAKMPKEIADRLRILAGHRRSRNRI